MGHAQRHLVDFRRLDPDLSEDDVAKILEHVRQTGTRLTKPGPHGESVYEGIVEIGDRQTRVRVVESSGGIIKTGFPID
jgi:hypothetical protein